MNEANTLGDNFYETLDLRYPEIAIALEDIDRCNPGKIKFCIPILTPNMPQTPEYEEKVTLDKGSLINKDKGAVEVSNIEFTNYIEIEIPRELCALAHCTYNVLDHPNSYITSDDAYNKQEGIVRNEGCPGCPGAPGSSGCSEGCSGCPGAPGAPGCESGNYIDVHGHAEMNHITGLVELCPVDEGDDYRYIRKFSKWLVMFIGGDINKPAVICRLPG